MKRQTFLTLVLLGLASPPAMPDSAVPGAHALPESLRETGLFIEGSTADVQPGVLAFTPQYPLWSDGASKRRWIRVPPGTSIDASHPEAWRFPPGTRLWKEFSLGRRIETRVIDRQPDGTWRFASYVWRADGSDATLAPAEGLTVKSPRGSYPIPSEMDCRACHEAGSVPVLGFTALQLSPDRDPLAPHVEQPAAGDTDLPALVAGGWIRNLPPALLEDPPRIPARSPRERAALGYLHANCGYCHGAPSAADGAVPVDLVLGQNVSDPESSNRVLRSLIDAPARFRLPGTSDELKLVAPGRADASLLVLRSRSREPLSQMPPLGTAIADTEALALIEHWIDHSLSSTEETSP